MAAVCVSQSSKVRVQSSRRIIVRTQAEYGYCTHLLIVFYFACNVVL